MYGKIIIKTSLTVVTGLHIGGSDVFSAIGAVDSPVARDPLTNQPIIPGSSLKGKLRTLLASALSNGKTNEPDNDSALVKRLFGTGASGTIIKARLQFADAFLANSEELEQIGGATEVKFENVISRSTAVATPRQIERVVRGAVFDCCIVYNIEEIADINSDLENLARAMQLLQIDYLGGHGTRGSGRVSFGKVSLNVVENTDIASKLADLTAKFREVTEYELLPV